MLGPVMRQAGGNFAAKLRWKIGDHIVELGMSMAAIEKLEQVRAEVVKAWKLNKARENILLPRARKIAEAAAKSTIPNITLVDAFAELKAMAEDKAKKDKEKDKDKK